MQARVRLSCSNSLIYTGLHTFQHHASPSRAAADGVDWTSVRSPTGVFSKIIRQILPSGPLRDAFLQGTQRAVHQKTKSIDSVCCGNIWKETNKLVDPYKLSVVNSLNFSCVPQTHSSNLRVWVFLSTKRVIGLIGTEKCCPMFVEINSNSIDGQTRPLITPSDRFHVSIAGEQQGVSVLPHYQAPLVCAPDVIGGLAV